MFVNHVGYQVGSTAVGDVWREVRDVGVTGVLLFFVLSGYLLAQPSSLRGGAASYAWRRVARIYPVYLLALVLAGAYVALRDVDDPLLQPATVLANLLLVQSWSPSGQDVSISLPAWSLSVEALFYVLLPFTLVLAERVFRRHPTSSRLVLITATAVSGTALQQSWVWDTFPPAYLPVFYLGVHAAVVPARWPRVRVSACLALVGVVGYVLHPNAVIPAVAFMVLIGSLAQSDRAGQPHLGHRVWQRFGVWSYAFFLLHTTALAGVSIPLDEAPRNAAVGLGVCAFAFALAWAGAALVYVGWEEPARRWVLRKGSAPELTRT